MSRRLLLLCLLLLSPSGCGRGRGEPAARPVTDAAAPAPSPAPPLPGPRTTSASIAIDNLHAQVAALEQVTAKPGASGAHFAQLAGAYAGRAQVLGTLADLERALSAAERAVELSPKAPQAQLAHAAALAGLHRFDEAARALERAAAAGAAEGELDGPRAALLEASGDLDGALALRRRLADAHPGVESLGLLAALEGLAGDEDAARRHFDDAFAAIRAPSPIPVAWLELQRGLLEERAGRLDEARGWYERAVARLPQYATAVSHLAGLEAQTGNHERAALLLEPLTRQSDDPEHLGQLASAYARLGRSDDATAALTRARAGYDQLTARHPAAFADHAARFWLGPGADPARAHALARANLAIRATDDAYLLAIDAAIAADAPRDACAAADAALAARAERARPALLAATYRAYLACKRPDDAAAVDARLASPR